MQPRSIFVMAMSMFALFGCEQRHVSHTSNTSPAKIVQAADIPEFPIGSSIEGVSELLKESSKAFADRTHDHELLNAGEPCVLTHQFTAGQVDDRILCLSGSILGRSTHYFVFTKEGLLKVVRCPLRISTADPPENPWERMDAVLRSPPARRAELVEDVIEDFKRWERGMRLMEPNPASFIVPSLARKPTVKEGQEIVQWRVGEISEQLDRAYGPPLRVVLLDGTRSTRLYRAMEECGSFIAATVEEGALKTVFSHDFFDPRFWLDQLGEKHSPPWNPFEILLTPK